MEDEFEVDTSGRPEHTLLAVVKVRVYSRFHSFSTYVRVSKANHGFTCHVWQLLLVNERGYSIMRDSVITEEGKHVCVVFTYCACVYVYVCVRAGLTLESLLQPEREFMYM